LTSIGVGKTSILSRYIDNKFSNNYQATIGVEFGAKTIKLTDNTRLRLQVWDTVMKNFEGKKELNVKLIGRTRIIYDNNQVILSKYSLYFLGL